MAAAKIQEKAKNKPNTPSLALAPDPALALALDSEESEGVKGLGQGYEDPSVQQWHLSASLSVTGNVMIM